MQPIQTWDLHPCPKNPHSTKMEKKHSTPKLRDAEMFEAEDRKCERFLEGEVFPFSYRSKHSPFQKDINRQIPMPFILCIAKNLEIPMSFDCRIIRMLPRPRQRGESLLNRRGWGREFIPGGAPPPDNPFRSMGFPRPEYLRKGPSRRLICRADTRKPRSEFRGRSKLGKGS
ncbi:hypothetical protein AVEN_132051-1 [Araneus ventricosus]|uniref:Uncharacterized protein n=1 Tax=Araneus ventricosus TaxID=182803 RepID=A0A4Y2M089_ARAVE|nr:hypothetical protein AVEN_132051-1 [Araneus ventricosus]